MRKGGVNSICPCTRHKKPAPLSGHGLSGCAEAHQRALGQIVRLLTSLLTRAGLQSSFLESGVNALFHALCTVFVHCSIAAMQHRRFAVVCQPECARHTSPAGVLRRGK